jgi:putative intracellular protease/amidase
MTDGRKIGFVFIEKFADWEFGLLSASVVEWFGAEAVALTPEGGTVRSIAGFALAGERGLGDPANADLDAVAVVGSENWAKPGAPDIAALLGSAAARGAVVGGICAGTLALARAGLFAGRRHTSNGRQWITNILPDYAGRDGYQDVPHAVADGRIVSAPGSAPATFALEFMAALYPDRQQEIGEMRRLFSSEQAALLTAS